VRKKPAKPKKPRRVVLGVGYLIFGAEGSVFLVNKKNQDQTFRGHSIEEKRVRLVAEVLK
jgi:hypothetical protein